jgi:hypothetical protein
MPAPSPNDVTSDPEWIPHTFDAAGTNLTFVHVPKAAREALMFLSDEHFAGNHEKASFPAEAIAAALDGVPEAPLHFIFHTSFCCSTLLARALDVPGKSAVLREPDVLINLANRIIRSDDPANRKRLELVTRLLARPFVAGEEVIVKPSNFGNRLADLVLSTRPESRAILLYSDVETLLRSLLKRGMFGRIFARRLFTQLLGWSPLNLGYRPEELLQLTDVQAVALGWLMQISHFDAIARAFGDRVMLLDSAALLAGPSQAIGRAQALFGLGLGEDEVESIARGPVFGKHSKFSDRDYSAEERRKEHESATEAHSEEIEMVVKWIEAVASNLGAPLRPGR